MYQGQPLEKIVELSLSGVPVTGVPRSALTFKYWRSGDTSLQTATIQASDWTELENGLYIFKIPAPIMNTIGSFYFRLSGSGFDLHEEQFDVHPAPLQLVAQNNKCIITGNLVDLSGEATQGQQVVFRVTQLPAKISSSMLSSNRIVTTPDALGNFSVAIVQGAKVIVEIQQAGVFAEILVPEQPSAQLIDLLPPFP